MKRSDLIRTIQVKFGRMREDDAAVIIDGMVKRLTDAVANGDRVEIRGFGRFLPRVRAPKETFNPRTGKPMHLDAGKTILFRPSNELIKEMNNADI
ncbi:MAG: integration host factor subunit beta [Alphaproteobacteria bacterium]|nr:integration host factor subunit beta [Alphaproteobacteria bacterium]